MKYYCWRCQSDTHEMNPEIHLKLHEAIDDIRAYGKPEIPLNLFMKDKEGTIKVRPRQYDFNLNNDKRKVHTFKEDE